MTGVREFDEFLVHRDRRARGSTVDRPAATPMSRTRPRHRFPTPGRGPCPPPLPCRRSRGVGEVV